jgi:hypothetical protein
MVERSYEIFGFGIILRLYKLDIVCVHTLRLWTWELRTQDVEAIVLKFILLARKGFGPLADVFTIIEKIPANGT